MRWLRRKYHERDLEREVCADLELEDEEQRERGLRRNKAAMQAGRPSATRRL